MRKCFIVALVFAIAGCASGADEIAAGSRFGVEFSGSITPETIRIECSAPDFEKPAAWVDECNALASRFLGRLVAAGRLDEFAEPPFGMAGEAMKKLWSGVAETSARAEIRSLTLSREIERAPAE